MAFTDLGHEHFSIGLVMIMVLRSIEDMINVLALWLVLKNNRLIYDKCCRKCNKCVTRVCKAMNREQISLEQKLISPVIRSRAIITTN